MEERSNWGRVLCADYHNRVQQEATALISKMRGELDTKFRAEHQDLLKRVSCAKLQTTEIIKEIGRAAKEYGQKISEDKDGELSTIKKQLKRNHKEEVRKAVKQATENENSQEMLDNTPEKEAAEVERCFWRIVVCDNIPVCGACHVTSTKLSLCGACAVVWYCDEMCQEKDWEKHQKICPGSCSEDESENGYAN